MDRRPEWRINFDKDPNPWVRIGRPGRRVTLGLPSGPADVAFFRPQARVTCCRASFEIQAHEVTWGEYQAWAKGHPGHAVTPPSHVP